MNPDGLILSLPALDALVGWPRAVCDDQILGFDTRFLLWLHGWASPGLDRLMLGLTRLGDPVVVLPVVVLALGWFLGRRRWREALMLLVSCTGALLLNQGLKVLFARPRPELWPALIRESSYSFPSGHALGSLVLFGFLAAVLAHAYPHLARWIGGLVSALILLIGLSRLYLGVHYPTDVAAGYAVGALWLVLCLRVLRRLQSADTREG
ncbi:MAG: hypothetical protein ER33_04715 [Cyanobium sp. CACIAM 14]|nr:MAG: hypothetical protein ER33_04715 [Cyanobium sp. CACIAM 14]